MKDSISITKVILTKKENFLVNAFVFFTFWSFFTGFPIAFEGFFRTVLGGKLGLLFIFLQFFIYVYFFSISPRCFSVKNQKYAFVFTVTLAFIWLWQLLNVSEVDNSLITPLFSIPFFILLRDDLKIICIDRFIKILAIIFALALFEYFIYLLFHKGILLYSGLGRTGFEDSLFYGSYDQYILNIYYTGKDFPRFQCLCEEPGCIGTICGFLIYVTKGREEYKFQYFIFILAGVFAFSLAFFALFVLHFFLHTKVSFSTLIILLLLYIVATFVFFELFQNLLLYRLQGGIYGADNRVTADFSDVFAKALSNGDLWLPHGSEKGSYGAGVKMWIWRYGLVSFIIMFISYYYIFWNKVKMRGATIWACAIFFAAFWLSFYQRHWITNLDYMISYLAIPIFYSPQSFKTVVRKKKQVH